MSKVMRVELSLSYTLVTPSQKGGRKGGREWDLSKVMRVELSLSYTLVTPS